MVMKFEINLPGYGEPIIEQEINSPWLAKEKREIRISLPLGYERCRYKVFFVDLFTNQMIGPYFNGQVVDFSSFGSRIKVKAILDKEYCVAFSGTIEIPMYSYGEYCPFKITYEYTGLIDIDYYNLALSNECFSSENVLLERARNNMEPMLRAIISQILSQNHSSSGGISSELFYNLETVVNIAIQNSFHKLCTDYLVWCKPVSNIKIKNTNMEQVMRVLNTPIQIERNMEQKKFESSLRMREQALISAAEIEKERVRAAAQIGQSGVYESDLIQNLVFGNNFSEYVNNNISQLDLSIDNIPNLSFLMEKKK